MPQGIILAKFDPEEGFSPITSFPSNFTYASEVAGRVLFLHEPEEEFSQVSARMGHTTIISRGKLVKDMGPYFLMVFLSPDETIEDFEYSLPTITDIVFSEIKDSTEEDISKALEHAFFEIHSQTGSTPEQAMFKLISEPAGLALLRILTNGVYTRNEIKISLSKDFDEISLSDINSYIRILNRAGLIKAIRLPGSVEESILLIKDIIAFRRPAHAVLRKSKRELTGPASNFYLKEYARFFASYHPDDEDNAFVSLILLENDVYRLFNLLRKSYIALDALPKVIRLSEKRINESLNRLKEAKMIIRGQNLLFLVTDFTIRTFAPEYLAVPIFKQYLDGQITKEACVFILRELKENVR